MDPVFSERAQNKRKMGMGVERGAGRGAGVELVGTCLLFSYSLPESANGKGYNCKLFKLHKLDNNNNKLKSEYHYYKKATSDLA